MNFFTELAAYGQGLDIKLHIKEKNGKFTVSLQPQQADAAKLRPLIVTGTAAELDEGFLTHASGAIEISKGLLSNLPDVEKDAADAVAKTTAPNSSSKSRSAKKGEKAKVVAKSKGTPKTGKKKTGVKESAPVDMFGETAAASAAPEEHHEETETDDQDDKATEAE